MARKVSAECLPRDLGGGTRPEEVLILAPLPASLELLRVSTMSAGDGGLKFRTEWPELDQENWTWMKEHRIDSATGQILPDPDAPAKCSPETSALRRRPNGSAPGIGSVVDGGHVAREAGQGWAGRNRIWICVAVFFGYALISRLLSDMRA